MVGGISGWQLMILLLIVVLVFGTKRLRNIGSDLGGVSVGVCVVRDVWSDLGCRAVGHGFDTWLERLGTSRVEFRFVHICGLVL